MERNIYKIGKELFITSDEEIKECWVLNTHTNEVYFLKGFYGIQPITKKIILTTDLVLIKSGVQAIPDEFLEWFVKNPSCEWVEVESNKCLVKRGSCDCSEMDMDCQCLGYKIIIPKEEPKQAIVKMMQQDEELGLYEEPTFVDSVREYFENTSEEQIQKDWAKTEKYDQVGTTIDEFLEAQKQLPKESVIQTKEDADVFSKELESPSEPNEKLEKAFREFKKQETLEEAIMLAWDLYEHTEGNLYSTTFKNAFKLGAKWQQQQNKNLYSDKDVLELLNQYDKHIQENFDMSKTILSPKQWFEQFSKLKNG